MIFWMLWNYCSFPGCEVDRSSVSTSEAATRCDGVEAQIGVMFVRWPGQWRLMAAPHGPTLIDSVFNPRSIVSISAFWKTTDTDIHYVSSCLRLGAFIFSNPLWIKVGNHSFSEAGSEIRPCGGKDHWKDRHCWSFFHGVASELDGVRHWQPWGRLSCWGLHMCLGSRLLPLCVVSSFVRSSAWTHTHTLRILFGGLTGDVNISTFNRNRY